MIRCGVLPFSLRWERGGMTALGLLDKPVPASRRESSPVDKCRATGGVWYPVRQWLYQWSWCLWGWPAFLSVQWLLSWCSWQRRC